MNTDYVVKSEGRNRHYYEHRRIWESIHGSIPTGFHVHHINGNKKDNRVENLELVNASLHHSHHSKELASRPEHKTRAANHLRNYQKSMPKEERTCLTCETKFMSRKHNQHGFTSYCGISCRNKAKYRKKVYGE